jgi:alpha-D-xyloside xylohydrolase
MSRFHGDSSRSPWDYGSDAIRIVRDYSRLRYRLLPYIYTYACLAAETGLPIMRAMPLEFPNDPNTYSMDLQYMLGSDLMIAPIYNERGRRPVYLPAGQWVDYWTHELINGPDTRFVEAPLETLPMFVRLNALIPTIDPPEHITEDPFNPVIFDAYLVDHGHFDLHDTDGATEVSAILEGNSLRIGVEGVKKRLGLCLIPLPGQPAVTSVTVNGRHLNVPGEAPFRKGEDASWQRDEDGVLRVLICC